MSCVARSIPTAVAAEYHRNAPWDALASRISKVQRVIPNVRVKVITCDIPYRVSLQEATECRRVMPGAVVIETGGFGKTASHLGIKTPPSIAKSAAIERWVLAIGLVADLVGDPRTGFERPNNRALNVRYESGSTRARSRPGHWPLYRRVLQSRPAPFRPRLHKPGSLRKNGRRLSQSLSTKAGQVQANSDPVLRDSYLQMTEAYEHLAATS